MWTRLTAKNFMALQDVEIPLLPMTVFVGKSGCGKSSALLAAWTLARLLSPEVVDRAIPANPDINGEFYLDGPWATRRTARGGCAFELSARAESAELKIFSGVGRVYQGAPSAPARLEVNRIGVEPHSADAIGEAPAEDINKMMERGSERATSRRLSGAETLRRVDRAFTRVTYHRFNFDSMAQASIPDFSAPGLAVDGANLGAHLSLLAGERPELFAELSERLRAVIPRARRMRVVRERVRRKVSTRMVEGDRARDVELDREDWGFRVEVEMVGEGYIAADLLSEGTVMTLGVLVAALGSAEPQLLLLDDVDRALHPSAHAALIDRIRAIQQDHPGLQVVATSRSPYVVNAFSPDEIVVFARDQGGEGQVHARRLSAHPLWPAWSESLLPGEFWSGQGERWIEELTEGQA